MSTSELIFDKQAALERMAFDTQLFREMIDLLRQDGPRRMQELTSALKAGRLVEVHHAAHSLKGLAANFSAAPAVQAAAIVEQLAKAGDGDGRLPAAVVELRQALDDLLGALALQKADSQSAGLRAERRESAARS
jgi:HPt (histidine-containing phosphotransfer) domain-containing protein